MWTPDNYRHVLMRPDVRICLDRIRQLQPSEATLILNSWERGLELDRWRSKNYLGKPPETSMHNHRTQERRVGVKYCIGGHRALTDISPASHAVRCRAPISNGEASGWASHAKGGNVSQAATENFGPKRKRSGGRGFVMMC